MRIEGNLLNEVNTDFSGFYWENETAKKVHMIVDNGEIVDKEAFDDCDKIIFDSDKKMPVYYWINLE